MMIIDNLQYANWSEKIFNQMIEGNLDAVHVTISYHETFRETVLNFEKWNLWFEKYSHLIIKGNTAADIDLAKKTKHATSKQAAQIAKDANAKKLVIGHYSGRYKDISLFKEEASEIFMNTELAEPGKIFNI